MGDAEGAETEVGGPLMRARAAFSRGRSEREALDGIV
jgi:hypothetical protein